MSTELKKIQIFLVDDHSIVNAGISKLLENNSKYLVVGDANTAEDLLLQLNEIKVDLVITDISLDGMDGIELTKRIKKQSSGAIKVLVISMHNDEYYINSAFEAGANGFLIKDFEKNEFYRAIDRIMENEIFMSRSVSKILADRYLINEFGAKSPKSFQLNLSKREIEIIKLISLGLSNKQIAEKINLSVSTIDVHRYNILKKMDVKNTAELIMKALKLKIITPD